MHLATFQYIDHDTIMMDCVCVYVGITVDVTFMRGFDGQMHK